MRSNAHMNFRGMTQRSIFYARLASAFLLCIASFLSLSSCGKDKSQIDCGPEDQRGSYMPKLDSDIVRVMIDPSAGALIPAIEKAVQTWNHAANGQIDRPFFSFDRSRVFSGRAYTGGSNGCDSIQGDSGAVLIALDDSNPSNPGGAWSQLGLTASNPAVTIRCSDSDRVLLKQVIVVNGQALRDGQITSIILHELGHAIGLDHSCTDGQGRGDYASCAALSGDHPYRAAVMYPRLSQTQSAFGGAATLQTKESLSGNDLERMQCLYSE
jgi:hypothetical protein